MVKVAKQREYSLGKSLGLRQSCRVSRSVSLMLWPLIQWRQVAVALTPSQPACSCSSIIETTSWAVQ